MAYDYAWLQTEVLDWLHRPTLAAKVPAFVALAEKRINGDLDARLQQATATLNTITGVGSVTLPADFAAVRALTIATEGELTPMPLQALAEIATTTSAGLPQHYALSAGSLVLAPVPDASYPLSLTYRAQVPALADAPGGTNWLLAAHHDIYLAATLCSAFLYTRDTANLQVWDAAYRAAMAALNNADWASTGSLMVRTDTRNQ